MQIRDLQESEVTFSLRVASEHAPVRGNALASGDDAADKECEDAIIARLDSGDEWAWCCVIVTARWGGFEGTDSLGCCSYENEEDFKRGGYFGDMKATALDNLRASIEQAAAQIAPLVKEG